MNAADIETLTPECYARMRADFPTVLHRDGPWLDGDAQSLVDRLSQQVAAASQGPVLIDLTGVTFLDSIGLTVLVATAKECQKRGWDVTVAYDQMAVGQAFRAVQFARLFRIVEVS